MTKIKTYACKACGLHYENEQLATDCDDFCTSNNACSLEITKHAVETKAVT